MILSSSLASLLVGVATALLVGDLARPPRRATPVARAVATTAAVNQPASSRSSRRRSRLAMAVFAAALVMFVFGPLLALGLATAAATWPRVRSISNERAVRRAIDAALPDAIEMMILVVHAGLTPHQAITMLEQRAPLAVRPAFAEVHRRVLRGAPLADALRALGDELGPSANVVGDTLAMAERYGTPIGQALEQLATDVRERRRRQAEADARKLPIRMSFPLVACTLPSFILIAIVPAVLAALSSLGATGF